MRLRRRLLYFMSVERNSWYTSGAESRSAHTNTHLDFIPSKTIPEKDDPYLLLKLRCPI